MVRCFRREGMHCSGAENTGLLWPPGRSIRKGAAGCATSRWRTLTLADYVLAEAERSRLP